VIDSSELRQNHLLAALPAAELARVSDGIAITPMPLGYVPYESGDEMRHVYFPTTSIVSLLYVMEDGSSAGYRQILEMTKIGLKLPCDLGG
jgi:hypothetical protein